ncbi:hypothetical protein DH2020_018046 [Rehmannia glutinosa]|uniref:Delta(14)-sterol reductase n=1 Tax=Rehmannia glutinosa TaxID=99300 RepID=A0ABR0WL98_REHGL
MDLNALLHAFTPSLTSVAMLLAFFTYLAIAGSILPGRIVPGVTLSDGTRLHYRCNGLLLLILLVSLLGIGGWMDLVSPTAIADRGLELLSTTLIFSLFVTLLLYMAGCRSRSQSSSFKPHFTGNLIHDWFYFVRAGMMGWLLINLSVLAKWIQETDLSRSMILYQIFCVLYILDYFFYEEYMTSTWDIIAERLGFMLVFGDLGWWLLKNEVELTTAAVLQTVLTFNISLTFNKAYELQYMVTSLQSFCNSIRRVGMGLKPSNGLFPMLVSLLLKPCKGLFIYQLAHRGIARHSNYLGDLLLALSFSLPCGTSSPVPYFYPIYLFILLIWRERRDEARCAQKYKEIWAEYTKLVPWRILPYVY